MNEILLPIAERVQHAIGAAADLVKRKCDDDADDAAEVLQAFGKLVAPALRADTARENTIVAAGVTSDTQLLAALARKHLGKPQPKELPEG